MEEPGRQRHVGKMAHRNGRQRERRSRWIDQAAFRVDWLRRVDLRSSEQNSVRQCTELFRCVRQSCVGKRNGGGRFCPQNASGFPRFHYECPWEGCLSNLELYLAADSRTVQGSCEGKNPQPIPQLDGDRRPEDDHGVNLRTTSRQCCCKSQRHNKASSVTVQGRGELGRRKK